MKNTMVRLLLFAVLALASAALILFMRSKGIGLESLIAQRDALLELVKANAVLAGIAFILIYVAVVASSGGSSLALSWECCW